MGGVPKNVFEGQYSDEKSKEFSASIVPIQEEKQVFNQERLAEEILRADTEARQLYLSIVSNKKVLLDESEALLNNMLLDQKELLAITTIPAFKDRPEEPFSVIANVFATMSKMIDYCDDKEEVRQILQELYEIVTVRRKRREVGGAHIKDREVRSDYIKLRNHMDFVLYRNHVPGFQEVKCKSEQEVRDMWAKN